MDSVFIISDRVKKPFMVIISRSKGTEFKPLTSDAKNLSRYLIDEYKNQPITKGELSQVIDENMDIQGPSPINSATKKKIERLISESELPKYPKGTSPPKNDTLLTAKSAHVVKHLPVLSISEVAISEFSTMEHRNVIQYKAASFVSDQTKTTFNYEVKRVRAMWDPSLSIPGTDRRGGWRCPVGTRYGGQITDRFGRNCGWGVARRIANAITNIGDRLENIDDRRRGRRVERRNARMIERLRRDERGGRLERGLRGVADVLEGGEASRPTGATRRPRELTPAPEAIPSAKRPKPRREEKPETAVKPRPKPRVVTPVEDRKPETSKPTGGSREEKEDRDFLKKILEGHPDGIEGPIWDDWVDITEADEPVIKRLIEKGLLSRKENNTGIAVGSRAKYQYEVTEKGKKFLRGEDSETPKPVAPRRPRAVPKPKDAPEGSKLTPKEARDIKPNEEFSDYVLRKYNEYAKRVREIREGGGNAGMLRRAEWYAINKDNLRDAWGNANGRVAPESFEPPAPRPRRPRNNRNRRRNASDANAEASASRRPKPEDKPEVAPISPIKPKKRVDKNAPTKDFEHSGTAYRDAASAQDKARQLVRAEEQTFHVVRYDKNGHDGGADKFYVLDDEQYQKLRDNESMGGKWAGVGVANPPNTAQQQAAEEAARILAEADAERARDREPLTVPDKPESGADQGGKLNNLFNRVARRKKAGRKEAPLGVDNAQGINVGVAVAKGNKGINTAEDAKNALREGADLGDIPDDFMFDALTENAFDANRAMNAFGSAHLQSLIDDGIVNTSVPVREFVARGYVGFITAQALASTDSDLPDDIQQKLSDLDRDGKLPRYMKLKGGSAASPYFFFAISKVDGKYRVSGEGFIVKQEDQGGYPFANLHEVMGVEVAQILGAAQEGGRVDGKINSSDRQNAIVLPIGLNFVDGKQKVGKFDATEKSDMRLHALMTNMLLGVTDRHQMNQVLYLDSDGKEVPVPIDFGRNDYYGNALTLRYIKDYAKFDYSLDPRGGFRSEADKQRVNELGKQYIENLKKIDFDDLASRLTQMWKRKGFTQQQVRAHINILEDRVARLIDILENNDLGDIIINP